MHAVSLPQTSLSLLLVLHNGLCSTEHLIAAGRWETTVLLGNLRRAVQVLQGQNANSRLRQKLLAWREWAGRRRQMARGVASRLQGRYLGGVWQAWREFVQYGKLSRSQGMAAIGHFTAKTTKQVATMSSCP